MAPSGEEMNPKQCITCKMVSNKILGIQDSGMDNAFIEGWNFVQVLGEGAYGE